MQALLDSIYKWFSDKPIRKDIVIFVSTACLCFIVYKIVKQLCLIIIKHIRATIVHKTQTQLDDCLFQYIKFERAAFLVYAGWFSILSFEMDYGVSFFQKLATIVVIWTITKLLHGLFDGLAAYTERDNRFQGKPYRSYIQVLILIIYSAAVIISAGVVSGNSPWALLSGIGAMTAVLLLVFRETILSFVASLQISSYDLVRRGDWISVPKYDADGDVLELALHTIKIQNWDKTISVVPTHDLMESGFKNWRGMQETGGRRIKRSLFLDVSSVKFMDEALRIRLGKINLLKDYFIKIEKTVAAQYSSTSEQILNDNRLTNLGTFRAYVTCYLRSLQTIRQDLTFLVRQLEPGPTGIPLEIYVFTATTEWVQYETIQADIFDHLFASVHEFELRIFQYPATGMQGISPAALR